MGSEDLVTVIDCFMVCYETDVIDIRIVKLADVVDAHHAVQGTTTFRGDPLEPQHLSEPVVSRLVEMPEGDPDFVDPHWSGAAGSHWHLDKYLRDTSLNAAAEVFGEEPLYLVCDGDEIPHPASVAQAVAEYPRRGPRTLPVRYYEWYANWIAPDKWQPPHAHTNQPVIGRLKDFARMGGAHAARCARSGQKWPYTAHIGWHLSNLGDAAFVARKWGQFAHAEMDTEHARNMNRLEQMRTNRMDAGERFPLQVTDDMPSCIQQKFPHLIGA